MWILSFAIGSFFNYWVVYGGGAARLEGWVGFFSIGTSPYWSADQIKLYCFCLWWILLLWFIVGIFQPELRRFWFWF